MATTPYEKAMAPMATPPLKIIRYHIKPLPRPPKKIGPSALTEEKKQEFEAAREIFAATHQNPPNILTFNFEELYPSIFHAENVSAAPSVYSMKK